MVEKEAIKEKESELKGPDHYDRSEIRMRENTEKARKGIRVLHGKNRPWELNRQGYIRTYMHDDSEGLANNHWSIFSHDIRAHSGKHRHQGGINLFVLKGKGYTTVDGQKYDWKEGDLILLPIKKGGVEHQHFNADGKPSRWVAFRHIPSADMIGRFREQKENFTDWDNKKT
ncbi:MAG: cupin domain-containing protein [Candidatus Tectomicrobia bacterium]|uniref:Cupin domain-containing protein n=1 Tax=Tectimicrobiota bacterium TaxID=2528274 RepID=A0A933GK51_UNCTE|nr:cupin domain-containing protein [Candidatus Tectomicrobia bacterium]